jgi:predicted metalloprotease with PDZ domain
VTYRETYLLVSNTSYEANSEQMVVMVVSHELAHQWSVKMIVPHSPSLPNPAVTHRSFLFICYN